MKKEEKVNLVAELTEKFKANNTFYLTNASGLSVAQVNDFRRLCFEKGVEYKVYKNTFIKKALENLEGDYTEIYDSLKGFSGIIFSEEVANMPAKVIKEYRKKRGGDTPALKAASIDADFFIGEEHLSALSELKSKPELIGEVIGLLQSPAKNVLSALQSGGNTLSGLVKALEEK